MNYLLIEVSDREIVSLEVACSLESAKRIADSKLASVMGIPVEELGENMDDHSKTCNDSPFNAWYNGREDWDCYICEFPVLGEAVYMLDWHWSGSDGKRQVMTISMKEAKVKAVSLRNPDEIRIQYGLESMDPYGKLAEAKLTPEGYFINLEGDAEPVFFTREEALTYKEKFRAHLLDEFDNIEIKEDL